jgi:hypothetical protein
VLGNSEPGRQDRLDSGSGNVENVGIVLSKPNHTTITEKSVAGYLCAGLLGCGIAIYETGGEGGIQKLRDYFLYFTIRVYYLGYLVGRYDYRP